MLGFFFLCFEFLVFRVSQCGWIKSSTTPGQIGHAFMVGKDLWIVHGFTEPLPFIGDSSKVGEMAFRVVQDAVSMAGNGTRRGFAAA